MPTGPVISESLPDILTHAPTTHTHTYTHTHTESNSAIPERHLAQQKDTNTPHIHTRFGLVVHMDRLAGK